MDRNTYHRLKAIREHNELFNRINKGRGIKLAHSIFNENGTFSNPLLEEQYKKAEAEEILEQFLNSKEASDEVNAFLDKLLQGFNFK